MRFKKLCQSHLWDPPPDNERLKLSRPAAVSAFKLSLCRAKVLNVILKREKKKKKGK